MLKQNDLVGQFNKEEQKRRKLKQSKYSRRAWFPRLNRRTHKILDRLDEACERRAPVDCISRKWVKSDKP